MDENELRAALRTTITQNPEPPPMESRTAIAAGRRASRRRNLLAGCGAAAAILAVTLAAVPGQSYFNNNGGTGIQAAGDPSGPTGPLPTQHPGPSAGGPSGVPSDDETKPSWPAENSGDATADSGDHYDKGKALLTEILAAAPAGYTVLDGVVGDGIELRSHQATAEGDYWAYMATIALRKGSGTGGLVVEVREPGNGLPTGVCEVAKAFWGRGGACTPKTVNGVQVGVVVGAKDAWAGYRHTDGTVVYVMQEKATTYGDTTGFTPLPEFPLSTDDLAELAVSERFR